MSLIRKYIFEFYYDPNVTTSQKIKCDIKRVLELLDKISKTEKKWKMTRSERPTLAISSSTYDWKYETKLRDTSKLSKDALKRIYFTKAAVTAMMKKYDVKTVFGTEEKEADFFGKEVPALLIYKDSNFGYPRDVIPRIEKNKLVVIEEYLSEQLK